MIITFKLQPLAGLALGIGLMGCNNIPASPTGNNSTTLTQQTSTTQTQATAVNRPLVVATTSVLCDLTQQIARDTIDLKCLVGAGEDPHVYQPKPEDRKAIESAQLILYAGYNFDPSLIKLVKATSNPATKVAVHEAAVPKPILGEAHDHNHDHETTSQDDKNTAENNRTESEKEPDPHVWHDAKNGINMVNVIVDYLKKLEPNNKTLYETNARNLKKELTEVDNWIKTQIATIPEDKRKLVTTHDALGYYVNAYGLSYEGALQGLSTDEAPTAQRVSELVGEIKKAGVPTIFAETTVNPKLIEAVAKEANVKVSEPDLYADGLGEKASTGESYQKMLMANTQTIVEGLGGKYTPFAPK